MARALLLLMLVAVALAPAASTVRAAGLIGPVASQTTARALGAGEAKTYSTAWSVPRDAKPGEYMVKVGAFPPGWGRPYSFNGEAATFAVGR